MRERIGKPTRLLGVQLYAWSGGFIFRQRRQGTETWFFVYPTLSEGANHAVP
jgi:hypothetical protein